MPKFKAQVLLEISTEAWNPDIADGKFKRALMSMQGAAGVSAKVLIPPEFKQDPPVALPDNTVSQEN